MLKKELRLKYKAFRQALHENEIETMSLEIANQALSLPIWDKTYFHIFLPIEPQKEINTEFLLHILSGKDKEIILSKSDFDTRKMTHFLLTDNTRIVKNEYQIPEPVSGIEIPSKQIEVVFVPLLAYDQQGNRVGYGKGFYDQFLTECKPETLKIGMSFFAPEDLISDVFANDIPLDYCITPKKVWEFSSNT
ncbi:MAG: 5-formyltetrahydrofolate cyclo-ligase [Flavobacterium sp.]